MSVCMQLLFFVENYVNDDTSARPGVKDFNALLDAKHWNGLVGAVQQLLTPLRVDGFMKKMRILDSSNQKHIHIVSSLGPAMIAKFRSTSMDDIDPIAKHVESLGIPFEWQIDTLCRAMPESPYRELKDSGVLAGLSIAARSACSFSRVDFYSRTATHFSRQVRSDLMLISSYMNEAVRAMWLRDSPKIDKPVLTAREQECLRWSASGKTSNEIGAILGISHNTVYFHLKNAASKFQVYGTRHAISRAIETGLI